MVKNFLKDVTILILIDGFLQFVVPAGIISILNSHNPYFNRWFSAIKIEQDVKNDDKCHNPYFNRWFSAILNKRRDKSA